MSYPYRYTHSANNQQQPTNNQPQQNHNAHQWMNQAFHPYANNNTNNNQMHQMHQPQFNPPNQPFSNAPNSNAPNSFYPPFSNAPNSNAPQYGNNPIASQFNVNPYNQSQSIPYNQNVARACQALIDVDKANAATKFNSKKDDQGFRCIRVAFYLDEDITGHSDLVSFLKSEATDKKGYVEIKLAAKDSFVHAITNHLTNQNTVFDKLGFSMKEICKLTASRNWKNGVDLYNKKIKKVKSGQNHAHMYAALLLGGKIIDGKLAKKFKIEISNNDSNSNNSNNNNANNTNTNNNNSNNNNSKNMLPPHVQQQSHHVPQQPHQHPSHQPHQHPYQHPHQYTYPQQHPNAPPQQHPNAPPQQQHQIAPPQQQHPNAPPVHTNNPNTANNFNNQQNMNNLVQQQIDKLTATCANSNDFFRLIHILKYPTTSTIPVHILIDIIKHNLTEDEMSKIENEFDLRFGFREVFVDHLENITTNQQAAILTAYKQNNIQNLSISISDVMKCGIDSIGNMVNNEIIFDKKVTFTECETCQNKIYGSECEQCVIMNTMKKVNVSKKKNVKKKNVKTGDKNSGKKGAKKGGNKVGNKGGNKDSNKVGKSKKGGKKNANNNEEGDISEDNYDCNSNTNENENEQQQESNKKDNKITKKRKKNAKTGRKNKTNVKQLDFFIRKHRNDKFKPQQPVYVHHISGSMGDTFWPAVVESIDDNKLKITLLGAKKIDSPKITKSRANSIIQLKTSNQRINVFPSNFMSQEYPSHDEGYYWQNYLLTNELSSLFDIKDNLWKAWKFGETILRDKDEEWYRQIELDELKQKRKEERQLLMDEQNEEEERLKQYKEKWGKSGCYDGRTDAKGCILTAGMKIQCIDNRPGKVIANEKETNEFTIIKIGPGWEVEGRPRDGLKLSNKWQQFGLETYITFEGNDVGCYVRDCLLVPGEVNVEEDEVDRELAENRKQWNEKNKNNKLNCLVTNSVK